MKVMQSMYYVVVLKCQSAFFMPPDIKKRATLALMSHIGAKEPHWHYCCSTNTKLSEYYNRCRCPVTAVSRSLDGSVIYISMTLYMAMILNEKSI